jgi:hypothetical protein
MKPIDEARFQKKKPDEIAFSPAPVPTQPDTERTSERSNERTDVQQHEKRAPASYAFSIEIPHSRRKTRQSFDIFEDQYDALKKLQIAEHEHSGEKAQKLGEMVQDALDIYIREKAKKLSNITVREGE